MKTKCKEIIELLKIKVIEEQKKPTPCCEAWQQKCHGEGLLSRFTDRNTILPHREEKLRFFSGRNRDRAPLAG